MRWAASSGCVLSWLWSFVEIPSLWCWDYTWRTAGTTTIRIQKDRSSSSASAVAFFLLAAVFNFLVRLAVVFGRSFTCLDDGNSSHRIFFFLEFVFVCKWKTFSRVAFMFFVSFSVQFVVVVLEIYCPGQSWCTSKSLNIRNESFDVSDNLKRVYIYSWLHMSCFCTFFVSRSSIGYKHKGLYHTKGLMMQLLLPSSWCILHFMNVKPWPWSENY